LNIHDLPPASFVVDADRVVLLLVAADFAPRGFNDAGAILVLPPGVVATPPAGSSFPAITFFTCRRS